jgi:hypothetical protein
VVYWALRSFGGPVGTAPRPTPNVIPSLIPLGPPTMPAQAPADTATAVVAATDTSVPTFTTVPTEVAPPTATPFIPPADGVLFQDDFENGLKREWIKYSGQWVVADGKLTEVYQDSYSEMYSWIGVENPSWKNYTVDLTIGIFRPLTESDEMALAVRDNVVGLKYIGFEIDFWPHIYLSLISDTYSATSPIAGNNTDFTFPLGTEAQAEIKVEDDNYTLAVNGRTLQTVNISGYDSGGFRLGLYCRSSSKCPTFDNVKVMYLP